MSPFNVLFHYICDNIMCANEIDTFEMLQPVMGKKVCPVCKFKTLREKDRVETGEGVK